MSVTVETYEGPATTPILVGTLLLVLTDDSNENHVYKISQCRNDTKIPLNTIRVPDLSTLFGDNADIHSFLT